MLFSFSSLPTLFYYFFTELYVDFLDGDRAQPPSLPDHHRHALGSRLWLSPFCQLWLQSPFSTLSILSLLVFPTHISKPHYALFRALSLFILQLQTHLGSSQKAVPKTYESQGWLITESVLILSTLFCMRCVSFNSGQEPSTREVKGRKMELITWESYKIRSGSANVTYESRERTRLISSAFSFLSLPFLPLPLSFSPSPSSLSFFLSLSIMGTQFLSWYHPHSSASCHRVAIIWESLWDHTKI